VSARKGNVPDPTGDRAIGLASDRPAPLRPLVLAALVDCYVRRDRAGCHLLTAALTRCA
jgi:hypothetical protein